MTKGTQSQKGGELFIVDNSDESWKVKHYLYDWCDLASSFDIATGFFEIAGMLSLDGQWQKLDNIRILMGDEVSQRTKKALLDGIEQKLNASIENEKQKNDFLTGVPAIVEAIRTGKIECRVYSKRKFHAKAYITHGRKAVLGSFCLVGSSNFTYQGLHDNVELNVQISGREVAELQEWYQKHWDDAEDVSEDVLKAIERHTRDHTPFEVYAKSLVEYFRGHEMTASEWETLGSAQGGSAIYPILDQYQREGYQAVMKIAAQYGGAFLCDGVGLGKTFVGLMLIERLVMHDRKRVLLLVPKSGRVAVWESCLKRYLPNLGGDFTNLVILNHTDLGRGGEFPARLQRIKDMADVIVIDEAHHFRNLGVKGEEGQKPSRYWQLFDLIEGTTGPKQLYMLTATPINNALDDFRHMVELFTRRQEDYFATQLGIHSIRGHFNSLESALKRIVPAQNDAGQDTDMAEAQRILTGDKLFQELVVQRSRAYVKKSQVQQGVPLTCFPKRESPTVAEYSIKKTYGKLLQMIETAFAKKKPLFILGIYFPLGYYKGTIEQPDMKWVAGRQEQVVRLIRTQFLKRFESSAYAFERSCERLMLKLLTWATRHSETPNEKRRLDIWKQQHGDLLGFVQQRQMEFWAEAEEEDADEDIITDEMLEDVELLSRDDYKVEEMLADTHSDLDQIAQFLDELRQFEPKHDDKLKALTKLLKTDPVLKKEKVIIFSEFAETARYLRKQLEQSGIEGIDQIDSLTKKDRGEVIKRFSPYYNGSSSAELTAQGLDDIRVLISTDVLSEGLNLQDATRLINYDLHWNPVRLMQRIGRVDRRMNEDTEKRIIADHPEQKKLRGTVQYWNFLPPEELEELLRLYALVSHKTLRISKTFGIEGRKLLRPEDDYNDLQEFNNECDGSTTPVQEMRLELQELLDKNPDLAKQLDALPLKVFSGKEHPSPDTRAVFFCYRIPKPDLSAKTPDDVAQWTEDAGVTNWYMYNCADQSIEDDAPAIIGFIRSKLTTTRRCVIEQKTLSEIRAAIEKHIKNTVLKSLQAPIGVKPILKAWMELN